LHCIYCRVCDNVACVVSIRRPAASGIRSKKASKHAVGQKREKEEHAVLARGEPGGRYASQRDRIESKPTPSRGNHGWKEGKQSHGVTTPLIACSPFKSFIDFAVLIRLFFLRFVSAFNSISRTHKVALCACPLPGVIPRTIHVHVRTQKYLQRMILSPSSPATPCPSFLPSPSVCGRISHQHVV